MKKGLVGLGLIAGAMLLMGSPPAEAVVYCKYVGVPKGCVARPGVALRPMPVVYCKYIGYPKGCVAAPGVVLRPVPRGVNLGGPVNRIGVR